ncbi:MAG: hypothetical protein K6T78_06045 [Alicyclobacillus sp.]|nr:hypothetical protein [Alicyclobacillus sp.]
METEQFKNSNLQILKVDGSGKRVGEGLAYPRGARDAGSALFATVWLAMAVNLLCFVLWVTALRVEQVAGLKASHAQAYWLARTAARQLINGWVQGHPLTLPAQVDVNGATVTATLEHEGTEDETVRVEAAWRGAIDNLRFTFNFEQGQVTSWNDTGAS